MKITICGSLAFAKEILEIEKNLQVMGYTTFVPLDAHTFLTGMTNDRHEGSFDFAREGMLGHYDNISKSDAILVTNFEKNGIKGYVGGATLIEMGVACHHRKKIFVLHPLPHHDEVRYMQEINLMEPIVINNDLTLIK